MQFFCKVCKKYEFSNIEEDLKKLAALILLNTEKNDSEHSFP